MSRFTSVDYGEGYFERAEGSNYTKYRDDPGWPIIAKTMRSFNPSAKVLEVGCAKGYFVHHCLNHGLDARGFDISEYAVSKAAPLAKGRIYVADATKRPWDEPSHHYDNVAAWEFFEHIPDEDIENVLFEMIRVLKPGGQLWLKTGIVVPDDHPFAGKVEDHDRTHVAVHDRQWWEDLFTRAGLIKRADIEAVLDDHFSERDWFGRFFVWQKG